MSAQPAEIDDDKDALEWELIELVEEHGSERAALRALLHDFHVLLADADKAVSRGFVRGVFSEGARAPLDDAEMGDSAIVSRQPPATLI
jgi:hypothetical protein